MKLCKKIFTIYVKNDKVKNYKGIIMIKQIFIYTKYEIKKAIKNKINLLNDSWILISVSDHKTINLFPETLLKKIGCNEFLNLNFSDISKKEFESKKQNIILFNKEHAENIVKFIDDINNRQEDINIICCSIGINISGIIGLFICRYLKLNENDFWKFNFKIFPNFYILRILNDISGVSEDYIKFWENNVQGEKL